MTGVNVKCSKSQRALSTRAYQQRLHSASTHGCQDAKTKKQEASDKRGEGGLCVAGNSGRDGTRTSSFEEVVVRRGGKREKFKLSPQPTGSAPTISTDRTKAT